MERCDSDQDSSLSNLKMIPSIIKTNIEEAKLVQVTNEGVLIASSHSGNGHIFDDFYTLSLHRKTLERNTTSQILFSSNLNLSPERLLKRRSRLFKEFLVEGLGLDVERIQFITPQHPIYVESLHVSYPNGGAAMDCSPHHPTKSHLLREWIRDRFPRFYISSFANRNEKRHLMVMVNHDDEHKLTHLKDCIGCIFNINILIESLQQSFPQFNVILMSVSSLSSLTFRQRVELFSSSQIVISPSVLNGGDEEDSISLRDLLIFMKDDGKIIEIQNDIIKCHLELASMANSLDLTYRGIASLKLNPFQVIFDKVDLNSIINTVREVMTMR